MSLHKSLKSKGKLVRMRNVLKRNERIEALLREGRWNGEEDSPYGLPKVKVMKLKKRAKETKKKEDEEGGEASEAAASEEKE